MNQASSLFLYIFLVLSPSVLAENTTPENFIKEYFSALNTSGMAAVSEYTHPEELQKLKNSMVRIYNIESELGSKKFKDMTFGPEYSLEDISASTPRKFMDVLMHLMSRKNSLGDIKYHDVKIIGKEQEEKLIHVVVRFTMEVSGVKAETVDTISITPYKSSWALMLKGDISTLVKHIESRFKKQLK